MKIHFLKSSTVLIESQGVRVLTDPWLVDGEYYGAWHHYPPFEFRPRDFDNIDYIYISHIHPDHFSRATMQQLPKDIPVLLHKFNAPFLKRNVQALGFTVREIPHNQRTHLRDGLHINILAADDCDPQLCMKFFGCGIYETRDGSTQIDTLAVFDDGQCTVANVNDCPLRLARSAASKIREQYQQIDFLLVGYAGAGPFPQCFPALGEAGIRDAAEKKRKQFLDQGFGYLKCFQPRFYMPFAGTYTLGGKLASLNDRRGVPELDEALTYYSEKASTAGLPSQGVLLNSGEWFDLETETASTEYRPVDRAARQKYIDEVLSRRSFPWEQQETPELAELIELAKLAYERMNGVRTRINYSTETCVLIPLVEGQTARVSMKGDGVEIVDGRQASDLDAIVQLKVDPRLLGQILKGPRFGHWNNAEIGSHIEYLRRPETFDRGLHYCMNFFHS